MRKRRWKRMLAVAESEVVRLWKVSITTGNWDDSVRYQSAERMLDVIRREACKP